MNYSFNLVDKAWIPCVCFDGQVQVFSLSETLRKAHELRGIQGDSPLETAAIYRLLLAILHSAVRGPQSLAAWKRLWDLGSWDQPFVNEYVQKWKERFDLFHPEKPFYQAKDERVKPKSVISLVPEMVSGNNAVWFDHHTEDEGETLTAAKAARVLVSAQTFSLAGLSGLDQKFTDAPWARGVIFIVEGSNLFETLALNLLRYPDDHVIRTSSADAPAWEQDDPYLPERRIPTGYLDYLTWQNRRIWFIPSGTQDHPTVNMVTIAPGLRLDSDILDAMKLYRAGKTEGYFSIRFSEDRALWRDSAALFQLKNATGSRPPLSFHLLADLVMEGFLERHQTYRFLALGMANNQAKVDFFRQEQMPLPLELLQEEVLVEQLSTALDIAENVKFELRKAVQWMALLIISPNADGKNWQDVDRISRDQAEKMIQHWDTERFYWLKLDSPFFQFIEDLPNNTGAMDTWKLTIRRAAWQAFEQAASLAGSSARVLKSAVRARSYLGAGFKKIYQE